MSDLTAGSNMNKGSYTTSQIGRLAGILIISLLLSATAGLAQDVATGTATATVVTNLAVTASNPLAFGSVYQGVAATIDKNTATAGVFDITGQINADLMLYLSLPEYMATATGDDRMTISFSSTDADIDTALALAGDPTSFTDGWQGLDPHDINNTGGPDPCLGDAGRCAIFLGGKVTPSVNQTAGAYTADITLTCAYKGT